MRTNGGGTGTRTASSELSWPVGEPRLLPLLPLIYVAWADGDLTPAEMQGIRARIESFDWLEASARDQVARWLEPDAPPSPAQLGELLAVVRGLAARLPVAGRLTLVDLGLELARAADDGAEGWATPEVCDALEEIQTALGVAPAEVCRELLSSDVAGPVPSIEAPAAAFDLEAMTRLLESDYREVREEVREMLRSPKFDYQYGLDKEAYRGLVLGWCKELARRGLGSSAFPPEYGGHGDVGRGIAVFETLAFGDLSLLVKFGVQFGLFGGSVYFLGTKRHHEKYLRDIGSLELPGCYAMTEAGHGSNVRDIETMARFDPETDEFVIDTPSESARKVYIGNAARDGRMATVFAQLVTGSNGYGVHAFLVPIRSKKRRLLKGVRIEDSGEKLGLNGVDNGTLWFDRVRIPRENLLNRFADVSEDGAYTSPIAGDSKRFFTMLGTLVMGRISVAAASVSAAKSGLTIAVRYAAQRRQFGPAGAREVPILDYRTHQRRLLPLLATTYGAGFALQHLTRRFVDRTEDDTREVEVLAAGLKAYISWHAMRTLQTCREACGGAGYMAENRIAALRADTDVFATFEGDNTVLLQLVAKGLLTDYKQQFEDVQFFGLLKHVTGQAARAVTELNPIVTRLTDEDHLRDPEFQQGAFAYREEHLLVTAARRLKKRIDAGMDSFDAFNQCQDHLVALTLAHVERVILERFSEAVSGCDDPAVTEVLSLLRDLFALWRIEEDRGWFLESGYIERNKAKAIRKLVNRLLAEAREQAVPLVDAFDIPDEILGAPIGIGDPRDA